MAGVKGRSGKKLDSHWRDALWRAVNETDGKEKRLMRLARALVKQGMEGDVSALREIGDRLDGKPRQETDLTINDNRDPSALSDAEILAALRNAVVLPDDAAGAGEDSGRVH